METQNGKTKKKPGPASSNYDWEKQDVYYPKKNIFRNTNAL
jgi:hypothetical protein